MIPAYITNELGDVFRVDQDGVLGPIDPNAWGWAKEGGAHDHAEMRRSIDSLRALPGFHVHDESIPRLVPGPKSRGASWGKFADGTAPPAAVLSRGGAGTLGYMNRLSEAVGHVALRLPVMPDRSPMLIYDFVGGRLFRVSYSQPLPKPGGIGTVYVLDDGFGIKVGYTSGPVAKRISELQTGNSRRITIVAEVGDATVELETLLHTRLDEWNVTGEWFARDPLVAQAAAAGGFGPWIRGLARNGEWVVMVHPPYL